MFDSLIGNKFSNKCKHAIKCIATRINAIRKKKQAVLRFLRKDVADLIANNHDINAFGRIEALIVETNHASCYEIIQHYCEYITIQLPTLQKRECPHEAMEAIATLIYAAARFSDLPELCDLRRLFTERYGSHMESPVNAEFVEKIQKKSFSMDKKLRFMQDIAQEFSITWDCKEFEQKLSNPHARKESKTKMLNEEAVPCKGKIEPPPRSLSQKKVQPEPRNLFSEKVRKVITNEEENVEPPRKIAPPPYTKVRDCRKENEQDNQLQESITRSPWIKEEQGLIGLAREVAETDRAASMVPPPYTKPKDSRIEPSNDRPFNMIPPYVKPKVDDNGVLKDNPNNEFLDKVKPKPVSVRRRHAKPQAVSETESRTPSGQGRRHGSKQNTGDEDEEVLMDQLLVHYSKKGTDNDKVHRSDVKVPQRAASLTVKPISPREAVKGPARAASLQPEMLSPGAGCVHPRLPDYDDLAARFMALRRA